MTEVSSFNSISKNIITSSPYTIYQAGILASIVTGDPKYILFSVFAFIMGDGFNALEKKIAKKIMVGGQRPSGCGNGQRRKCTGCGIYPSHGTKSKTWGMPSGHAQITSFAATFWTLYVWLKYKKESDPLAKNKAIASTAIMWTLAACVWSQRVISLCHSIPQIIVGVIFGILFGVLAYFISTFIIKDLPLFTRSEPTVPKAGLFYF
jgi:membrane-associated phospholipid phosphatase